MSSKPELESFAMYPLDLDQETLNQYLTSKRLRMPASSYLRLIKKMVRSSTNSSAIQQFNLIFDFINFYGNPLDIQRAENTRTIIRYYDVTKVSTSLLSKLYLYLKEPLSRKKRSVLGVLTNKVEINRWDNYAFKLQVGKMKYELVNDGSYQELAYNLGEFFVGIQIQNLDESIQYFIKHKVKMFSYRAVFSVTPKVMVRDVLERQTLDTAWWLFRGLKGTALSIFDIGRIAQGAYTLHQPLGEEDYRDVVAQVTFASLSAGVEVGSKLLQMEEKINLLLVFTLVGSEMTYNGLNAIYEAKSYRLSLWQNFRLYWHTLFILPEPLDIQNLENEVDYRNYYFDHAIKRLKKMDSGTLIMVLGKLVNRAVNITRRETGGWLIGQRQIRKEKKYIAVSEAAFASIDLNQCETMTDGLEEVVMPQDSLNMKLIFAAIKPTCHVTNYGCANVLGVSYLKNDSNPDLSHIVYDLSLQDSGLARGSNTAETNTFYFYEGNSTIYGGGGNCKKNLFKVTGRFSGEIIGGESYSHIVENILDTSNLMRTITSVKFSNNRITLDQHQIFFTAIKLTDYIGGQDRYDFVDCQGTSLIHVDTLGGYEEDKVWSEKTNISSLVEANEYWWDLIKNCPKVMLNTFTRVEADVPANYFYFIKSGQHSIHMKNYTGNTTLFFDGVDFFVDIDFYYNRVRDSLEIRNKTQQTITKIDNYLTNSQTYTPRKIISFFDKNNHSLTPFLENLADSYLELTDQFVLIDSFIYRKETQLIANNDILIEYLGSIESVKSINLLGIVTQKTHKLVKIITRNWSNVVIPLGIDNLDFVCGDHGVDIYLLSFFDLKKTLSLKYEKEIHINNWGRDGIDILVVPVLVTELNLQREIDNLVISFLEFQNLRIIVDYYFLNEDLQHLIITDKLGREWVFLTNDISITLIPFYRDLSMQLKASVDSDRVGLYPIAIQADFSNFTLFNEIYGLNLEVFQENSFLEFSLENSCKENMQDLKIYSNVNARLIYEVVEFNYIDCLGLQSLRKLTIDREKILDIVDSRKFYFSLSGVKQKLTLIDMRASSNAVVNSSNPEAHLVIDMETLFCLLSREKDNLKFELFTRNASLGSAIVVDWLNPKNRLYSIESISMEITDLLSWSFDRLGELQKFINKELLKNYLEHWALTYLDGDAAMLHNIGALVLLLHMVDREFVLKSSAKVYKIINFLSYDSLVGITKTEVLNQFQALLTTKETIKGLILISVQLAVENNEILSHVATLFEQFSINSTCLIALNHYLPDFINSLANEI